MKYNMGKIICVLGIILTIFISQAYAASLIKTEIYESEYGSFLAQKGWGGALYRFTFSDGNVVLKYIEGKRFPSLRVTEGVARTIAVTTHISPHPTSPGIDNFWCDSIVATGVDNSEGYSTSCGSAQSPTTVRATAYPIWQSNTVEAAKSKYGYQSGRDTVTLNGVIYTPPVITPGPTPYPTYSPPVITPGPTPYPTYSPPVITPGPTPYPTYYPPVGTPGPTPPTIGYTIIPPAISTFFGMIWALILSIFT